MSKEAKIAKCGLCGADDPSNCRKRSTVISRHGDKQIEVSVVSPENFCPTCMVQAVETLARLLKAETMIK